jgi:hypothetical protein
MSREDHLLELQLALHDDFLARRESVVGVASKKPRSLDDV